MTIFSPSILHQYSIPFNKVILYDWCLPKSLLLRWFKRNATSSSLFLMGIMLVLTMVLIVRSLLILPLLVGLSLDAKPHSACVARTMSELIWIYLQRSTWYV